MIVAGFGFRQGANAESLRNALAQTGHTPDALATPASKANTPAFHAFAQALDLPVHAIGPDALRQSETKTQSQASQNAHGTGSVAEAAALAGAGPGARLLSRRRISDDRLATCAIAKGTLP